MKLFSWLFAKADVIEEVPEPQADWLEFSKRGWTTQERELMFDNFHRAMGGR